MTSPFNLRLAKDVLADCEDCLRELIACILEMRRAERDLAFLRSTYRELEHVRGFLDLPEEEFNRARRAQERLGEDVEAYRESLNKYVGVLERYIKRSADYVRKLRTLPSLDRSPIRREDVEALARVGWYVDPNLSVRACRVLAKALAKGGAEAVHERLAHYFRQRTDEIELDVTGQFPHREPILREAFEAHRQERYNLSVPVLLAQADGMCEEALGALLFLLKGRAEVHNRLKVNGNIMLGPLIELIGTKIPLWKFGRKDDEHLNRHTVLHGLDLRYGTEVNSLKAISFLSYIAFVLRHGKNGDGDAGDGGAGGGAGPLATS